LKLLPEQSVEMRPIPWYHLGYRGFEVQVNRGGRVVAVYNNAPLERMLLQSAMNANSINEEVSAHVTDEIHRLIALEVPNTYVANSTVMADCDPPVRGPDNTTVYDPRTDCKGCFITRQGENNCYNYGNDVLTNTFAQPGRGSGQKWSFNTCDDIRASATRDGLTWMGTTLPTKQAPVGHYLALLIWPNTNFHWIRFDSVPAGFWSHKPGGTAVRNVDNNNQKIVDPSRSNFSPWTQFCGYMVGIPSKVVIN